MRWDTCRAWLDALLGAVTKYGWDEIQTRFGPMRDRRVTIAIGPTGPSVIVGPSPSTVIGPDGTGFDRRIPVQVTPSVVLTIAPPSRAAWDEQGWRETVNATHTIYDGEYRVKRRWDVATFPGRILVGGGTITPYIADPPSAIKRHSKGPCFQLTNPPWFRVHWHRPPATVDDALLYVQRVLDEVLN